MKADTFNADALNNRGILKGVQCVCGQWWPDYVQHGVSNEFITECCGSLYLYQPSDSKTGYSTLSLIHDNFTKREVPIPS